MKILVLGREEDSLDYLRYCENHGIEATFTEPPSLAEIDRNAWPTALPTLVAETSELEPFDEIISFRDGYQVHTDLLRRHRGWPARDIDAVNCLTDKSLFKSHPAVREFVAQHIGAGVVRVDRPEDFRKAFVSVKRVCGLLRDSRGPSQIIAERYLDGDEMMVDGFVVDGKVTCLLFHVKLPRLTGLPSFHETGCVTQPFDGMRGPEFQDMLEKVIGGVGLDNSAFNAEFRYDGDGRLHILECAPRISGGGASVHNLLRICAGLDAYGIQHRLGREPVDLTPTRRSAALEYDFRAAKNGHLVRLEDTVALLRAEGRHDPAVPRERPVRLRSAAERQDRAHRVLRLRNRPERRGAAGRRPARVLCAALTLQLHPCPAPGPFCGQEVGHVERRHPIRRLVEPRLSGLA